MKDKLIGVLEAFCPGNVYLQGTLSEDYPESFCTFWVNRTEDRTHFDNDVASFEWQFMVYFYSSDPEKVNTVPQQIREALKTVGFIPQGRGYDLSSDVPTHTGWVTEYKVIEFL